jgi:hypothetical protein
MNKIIFFLSEIMLSVVGILLTLTSAPPMPPKYAYS